MSGVHVSSLDLNLLAVFDALMAEGGVTRAAERMGLTQPAVSHALKRMRVLLDDPLFVRTPTGMEPTPQAERLAAVIRPMLAQLETLLASGQAFEPAESARTFVVGMSDYAAAVLLPRLLKLTAQEAPKVRLAVKNTGHGSGFAMLDASEAELIAGNFPDVPPHLRSSLLFTENFICAARQGLPGFTAELTVKRYLALAHLQVSTAGNPFGYVDAILEKMQARRDVRVTVPHFLAAPLLLADADLVATEPRRLFEAFRGESALCYAAPPFAIPDFRVTMDWHSRHDADPGHVWLRNMMKAAANSQSYSV